MADIASIKRAVCTKAPGEDPAQKATAKANCEANMERVDVKACSYGTSVARATRCVKNLVPSIFDAPAVPATADDVVKKLGRGETPSEAELKLITPEYIKGLIANKDKDNSAAIKLGIIEEAAKTNDVVRAALAAATASKGGNKSGWEFGIGVAAKTSPDVTPKAYKGDKPYAEDGFTDPIYQPVNEQTVGALANPEFSLVARKDLGDGMKLHLEGSYGWTDYRLKLNDNRRDTLGLSDVTHENIALGAAILFDKKLSDTFTAAGGAGVKGSYNWVSTNEPYKNAPLGNGLVMEGNERTSNVSVGVTGRAELQAKISESWSAVVDFELEARVRLASPYTFPVSPTQSGELRFDQSSPIASQLGLKFLYKF